MPVTGEQNGVPQMGFNPYQQQQPNMYPNYMAYPQYQAPLNVGAYAYQQHPKINENVVPEGESHENTNN